MVQTLIFGAIEYRWLPTPITYTVQSPPVLSLQKNRVQTLIDRDSKCWNVPLLQATFNLEEARVIASIPLSPHLPPDRLIWLGTKNENFSVKSAYHLGLEIIERDRGQTSQVEKGTNVWCSLWNLQVPNPTKMFLWRACNDILPTRKNLLRRRVIVDGKCPWCNLEEETTAHVIWFCPAAKDVWNAGHSIFHKCAFVEHSFLEIFQLCLGRFSRDEMDSFATIARRIWQRCNEMFFEGVVEHPNKSYANAVAVVDDFKRCLKGDEEAHQPPEVEVRGPPCWMKPPEGTIKVNFDAAINKNSGLLGLGVIARDCMGYLLEAKRLSKHMLIDAHSAELIGSLLCCLFLSGSWFFSCDL